MNEILSYLVMLPAIAIVVTIHEYTKAVVSSKLGDHLPEKHGRLTLNPLKHVEPIGAICMFVAGVGWGQPTQTSPLYYKERRRGTILTYTLPSVANLLFGLMIAVVAYAYSLRLVDMTVPNNPFSLLLYFFLLQTALLSVQMALFNLIPVYPLDASKVLHCLLPARRAMQMSQYEKIFQMILVILIFLGIISTVIHPIARTILFFLF